VFVLAGRTGAEDASSRSSQGVGESGQEGRQSQPVARPAPWTGRPLREQWPSAQSQSCAVAQQSQSESSSPTSQRVAWTAPLQSMSLRAQVEASPSTFSLAPSSQSQAPHPQDDRRRAEEMATEVHPLSLEHRQSAAAVTCP